MTNKVLLRKAIWVIQKLSDELNLDYNKVDKLYMNIRKDLIEEVEKKYKFIEKEEILKFLNESYSQFKKSANSTKYEDTKNYYDGIADGMKNVIEYIENMLMTGE